MIGRQSAYIWTLSAILMLSSIMLHSCKEKKSLANKENDTEGELTIKVNLASFQDKRKISFSETRINGFYSSIKVVDTFLVCGDYRSPEVINIYGSTSGQLLRRFIKRGEQLGQCLSAANIIPVKGSLFWIYDITGGKMLLIDILKALSDTSYQCSKEIILSEATRKAKSPCFVNDSLFAATTYTRDDCRYMLFNTRTEIVSVVGKLPAPDESWPKSSQGGKFNMLASVYTAGLVHNPESGITVAVYNKTDRIEVYAGNSLKKVIRGPDLFDPVMDFVTEGNEVMANESHATRFSYSAISGSNKYFYCLYSGEANFNACSSRILVFDWDGNPVRILELDRPVCFFSVSETRTGMNIFGIEKETGNVLKAFF